MPEIYITSAKCLHLLALVYWNSKSFKHIICYLINCKEWVKTSIIVAKEQIPCPNCGLFCEYCASVCESKLSRLKNPSEVAFNTIFAKEGPPHQNLKKKNKFVLDDL